MSDIDYKNLFEIIAAAVTTAVAVATTIRAHLSKKKSEKNVAVATEEADHVKQTFGLFVGVWFGVVGEIDNLISETEIDRFLVLQAWNGRTSPEVTTAVYQIREQGQKLVQYIDVKLDQDYKNKLDYIIKNKSLYFVVKDIANSLIKRIYTAEGVKSSYWHTINIGPTTSTGRRSVIYCSFASHKGEISEETKLKCDLISDRLSAAVKGVQNEDYK